MKSNALLLTIVLILATVVDVQGRSYYNSSSNNFGGLFPHPGMRMQGRYKTIKEDLLVEENATLATALTIDTIEIASSTYRYQLRIANLNNKQGKTKSFKNPITGETTHISSTEWGLVFNYDYEGNYCAVVLNCDNSAPYNDITDQRSMKLRLIQRQGGNTTELGQITVEKGVSLEDEMNVLSVDVDQQSVKVAIGKNELHQMLEAHIIRPIGNVSVGYLVGPGARVAVERAVLTIDNVQQVGSQRPTWTLEALDEHFASSSDPNEGYWSYLDRDMEDEWLRLGGRYTLATVCSDDGYDIIYIDGAQVKRSMWQPGMLKGHITKTQFTGNYDLTWIDATMEPIEKDAYATIENGVILTLNFPVFKSQVRFAKNTKDK